MYNKFLNQKNLDFEKSPAESGQGENMITNGPNNAPTSSDNKSISNSGSASKGHAYNLKVSVKKQGPGMEINSDGNQALFAPNSGQNSMLNDSSSIQGTNNSLPQTASNVDKSESKKFRRISDKSQDHQRFFKNLIELPNGTSGQNIQNSNNQSRQNPGQFMNCNFDNGSKGAVGPNAFMNTSQNAMKMTQGGAPVPGCQPNKLNEVSSMQPNSQNNGYRAIGVNPAQIYGSGDGQGHPNYANQSAFIRSQHQNTQQSIVINGGGPQQDPQQQAYFAATRSRLSQSSQKHNQNRIAAAGAGSLMNSSAQQYEQTQTSNFGIKQSNTLSPQQITQISYTGNGPQGISNAGVSKEIYETLQKSSTALNATTGFEHENGAKTCPGPDGLNSSTSKKGHQVYEELRMKFQQQQGNPMNSQNNYKQNFVSQSNYGPPQQLAQKNAGSQSFAGGDPQYVGSGLGSGLGSVGSVGSVGGANMSLLQTQNNNGQLNQTTNQLIKYQRRIATGPNGGQIFTQFDSTQQQQQNSALPKLPSSSRLQERKKQMIMWSDQTNTGPVGTQFSSQQVPQSLLSSVGPNNATNNAQSIYKSVNTNAGGQNQAPGLGAPTASGSQIVSGPGSHNLFKQMKQGISTNQSIAASGGINQSPRMIQQAAINQQKKLSIQNENNKNGLNNMNNGYSRSQSRIQKQGQDNIQIYSQQNTSHSINSKIQQFNQYKNVININGQIENKNFGSTTNSNTNGNNTVQNGGSVISNGPNRQMFNNANYRPQNSSQTQNFPIGASGIQQFNKGSAQNQGLKQKKVWPEDDLPPPKISQNHYRHIHEQRDFTLENLSMAGETDIEDYEDLKFHLEYEWQLDIELAGQVTMEHHQKKGKSKDDLDDSSRPRCDTDADDKAEQKKKPIDGSPYYRCRHIDEQKKKRKELQGRNAQALYGNFMSRDYTHGVSEQDAQFVNLLMNGDDDIVRQEHRQITQKLTLLESQKNKLLHGGGISSTQQGQYPVQDFAQAQLGVPPGQSQAMTLAYFKQLEQLLMAQVKRLDIIKRLKQKAPVHESFKLQLSQEIKEYLRNTNNLKQRINRYSGGNAYKNQQRKMDGLFSKNLDADQIINQVNKNMSNSRENEDGEDQANGEEDPNLTTGVSQSVDGTQNTVSKKNNKNTKQQPKQFEINDKTLKLFRHFIDPNEKSSKGKKDTELLLSEQGIPASEIKLAKILMDKPAPHTTAQSWAIYDQKTNTLLFGKMERERRECASLTKIMTAYTVFKLIERMKVDETTLVQVTSDAAGVIGTSADLLEGDTLQI